MIGDFTWPGFGSDIAITEQVAKGLLAFGGFEPGPVEMVQDSTLKRPSGARRGKPRVWLPYEGPPLHDLWVTHHAHLNLERSSVRQVRGCKTCGRKQYDLDGIERYETGWDKQRRESVRTHVPRRQGLGIYVDSVALAGTAIFRTREFPSWILATDVVKEFVEQKGFTNVNFLEAGETL